MALMETQRHGAPQGCQVPRQWCAQPNLAPSPLPGTLQHPAALLESQAGCDNTVERGEKKNSECFFIFFSLPAPPLSSPLECASKFLAASLRAAAGFASDCLQRLHFSHTPAHGEGSPVAPCRLPITPSTMYKHGLRQSSKSRALAG